MSEPIPYQIKIGGKIRAADVDALCKAIDNEGLGIDWDEGHFQPTSAADLLDALHDQGTLLLTDSQRNYGLADELESFLVDHGIAFDAHCDAKYEYDAENRGFRPGIGRYSNSANQSGEELVSREEVEVARCMLRAGNLTEALKQLEDLLGPDIPDLEPLTIEGAEVPA